MDYYNDIESFIIILVTNYGSLDVAEAEFRRLIADDSELLRSYKLWCEERGYTTRNGFSDFATEYVTENESVWDALTDFDENE